ncbi:hypothetical protein K8352_05240 [Flavobacteriaceae bacterium F89]|uniref:Chromosome partitioning protein ParA n=1 Tax=Cerina litoralis TaxID=2874477 RepID=A0AAE3JS05_9FLAO|nr:hypothetical protein [Cerina litoralis]MCG2460142.1 hypothetical protein [Cerina litoralis]
MDVQDTKFNYKLILAALVAVIVGVLIAFYYSYAQSKTQINYLEQEKTLLTKDLTLMKAEVDRLSALNEVNDIELQSSKYRVQQLLDSVGRLTFTIEKLKEYKKELRILEAKHDSLKLKNNFLKYNNMLLSDKYEDTRKKIEELRGKSSSLAEAEALLRQKNRELSTELKTKNYLKLQNAEGSGFRMRSGRPIKTNKASIISKLRGCVTVVGNPNTNREDRVLYFQFLGPNMGVIEDNANTINVNGNTYSKKVEFVYMGQELNVCDVITIPEGSLAEGIYTLNVFENERLLSTAEFELK